MKKILAVLICFLSFEMQHLQADGDSHEISIDIKINCPMSDEVMDFVMSIPPSGDYASSYDEWKSSFIHNMTQLIRLVESEKVYNSSWSVKIDDRLQEAQKD